MKTVHDINLILHIISGFTALTTGIIPMIAKKGGKAHVRWGKIYFWGMFGVFLTAIVAFLLDPARPFLQFLLFVGIFSFHMALSGIRGLRFKKATARPESLDWAVARVALVSGLFMIGFGLWKIAAAGMAGSAFPFFSILYMVFGSLLFTNGKEDLRQFAGTGQTQKMHWFFHHITRMVGAYIATFTAFCVVNIQASVMPPLLVWTLPGIIGGIGIARWVRYYRQKFNMAPADLAGNKK